MAEEFLTDIIAQESKNTEATNVEGTKNNLDSNTSSPLVGAAEGSALTETKDDKTSESTNDPNKLLTIEDLATQLGWNPNFQGENAIDASTYILRSKDIQESMKNHNKDLKKQLNNLQGSVDALKEHNERVYKADVKRMESEIAQLKKQRREAIELADVTKVEELDNQISGIQSDITDIKSQDTKPSQNPSNDVYNEWVKDNQWYVTDDDMAKYADTVAKQYGGAPLDRIFKLVTNKVKEVFPEKFEQQKKQETNNEITKTETKLPIGPKSPVEGNTNIKQTNTFTKDDLTPEQMQIMRQFVQGGIMTEQQYINDIAKMREH